MEEGGGRRKKEMNVEKGKIIGRGQKSGDKGIEDKRAERVGRREPEHQENDARDCGWLV